MPRRADHIDQLVGRNIRVLRLKEGMPQTALASALESLIDRFVEQLDQVFMLRVFHVDTIC